ncbi:ImuA family protein [Devosia sediminis]|uniref:Protein ImuA n=1 Tax=Devosia sediminis TaxID=2798801 RepID=A0A934J2L0_9HYPH|nr:hypothetical protein [Devosia sediminis]MBJ3786524.1 hypothetical protein [Devosia sediminis]
MESEQQGALVFPALPAGLVQEIFADASRDGGLGMGFALAQAKALLTEQRPSVFYLQLASDAQTFGMPYGPGLASFGLHPSAMVIVRTADMMEFLWAVEEVISCSAVAAVVADIRGTPKLLNFTASRRLSLRASAHHVSLFLLRYGASAQSSASHLRWRVLPHRSGRNPYDIRAPGAPRWRLKLEKGRVAGQRNEWFLEWTDNGLAVFTSPSAGSHAPRAPAPLSGFVPALLGDGFSQAG